MKKNYAVIDKNINSLVNTFNRHGFITYASCQGHSFPVDELKPYIAFKAEINKAAKFEKLLREEMESISSRLYWGWQIQGSFNCEYELCFSLRMCRSARWYYKYFRSTINKDFNTIASIVSNNFNVI